MFVGGRWQGSPEWIDVVAPYSGEVIDRVPAATPAQVEEALATAQRGAAAMRAVAGATRADILRRAADLLDADTERIGRTISLEVGKPIGEARGEAARLGEMFRLASFEGTQLRGETLPLDAQAGGEGRLGFTLRIPTGVVVAITPFNYPGLLVVHKIAPALAAGNAVILKPASQAPLTALLITEKLIEAGLPEPAMQTITGGGRAVGMMLVGDPRVRKVSFTGSTAVGEEITRVAGVKRLSLELGANCPMVVMPDADVALAAATSVVGGYVNAGQVCISLQRVIVHEEVYEDYLEALREPVAAFRMGDPLSDDTRIGAMISEGEAIRVSQWIEEAVASGARVMIGGDRDGAKLSPTVVAEVTSNMKLFDQEVFGPTLGVTKAESIDHAIALANDSSYGLGAGIFTNNVTDAMRFAREVDAGSVHVNWTPLWRSDLMPYGGLKGSGIGKEGIRYAVEEMTELKTVVVHGLDK
ncbi:MAG: aldehyde dehydrogenase family protein [Acidimicrobiia bacterium]|nr:aldehyde dehydrogenase family protein [Acidimicrobiia bacterium]